MARTKETLATARKGLTVDECLDVDVLDLGLQSVAAELIKEFVLAFNASDAPEKVKDNDLFAQAKLEMARAHFNYVRFLIFKTVVDTAAIKDSKLKQHLLLLVKIHAIDVLLKSGTPAFQNGFFA